jgi:hypothetical protein
MSVTIPSLLQPLKDRLAAVTTAQNTRTPVIELDAAVFRSQSDVAKLIAAIEGVSGPVDALMAQLVAREERWKAAWESGELTHDEAVSATQEDRWAYGELAAIRFALTQALGGDTA